MTIVIALVLALLGYLSGSVVYPFIYAVAGNGAHFYILCYCVAAILTPIGVALYGTRRRFRAIYGFLQLAASFAVLLVAMNSWTDAYGQIFIHIGGLFSKNPQPEPPPNWLQWNPLTIAELQILVAIYVFVGAMDNIGEGLLELGMPGFDRVWRRVFPSSGATRMKGLSLDRP